MNDVTSIRFPKGTLAKLQELASLETLRTGARVTPAVLIRRAVLATAYPRPSEQGVGNERS